MILFWWLINMLMIFGLLFTCVMVLGAYILGGGNPTGNIGCIAYGNWHNRRISSWFFFSRK
ncbi:hypothetical protein MHYMCMPSP_00134 [Hyalomma marginatum]|uniref:Uncharacterized protein n=1 Tax=Hyalomma marginatum TaxID=34627 RepID=A0A8S4C204_9ACAR|nr:hypothetical protein MHYMCMPSP_00134 [Hyalomma marginatum]CAG7598824.1 hypothetical protein MHYMCMPASI_01047 [Hyalomma marginatum]